MKNNNVKKYADIATIGNTAARRWVDEGKLPAVHTGRKILLSWQNLMDYLTVSV